MSNSLGTAISPYLRQHAHDPIEWHEWSTEALEEAQQRDVPILLSIGYASCHWCHVMAYETFTNQDIARILNDNFVCIKVDREQRPDLDAIYMMATTALTGQGGWPITCFITPDGRPFHSGNYYPQHAFMKLLSSIISAWRFQRHEIEQTANQLCASLDSITNTVPSSGPVIDTILCEQAITEIIRLEDPHGGGFGTAPKFPAPLLMNALLAHYQRTGNISALDVVSRAVQAMAKGAIYDQLDGGFARYTNDAYWRIPHFEKMLYDNALLLTTYARWTQITHEPIGYRVLQQTAHFLQTFLSENDLLCASLDADSDGQEGAFYLWTEQQFIDVLGTDDAQWAGEIFGVALRGTFDVYSSVLQRCKEPDDQQRFEKICARLKSARMQRTQPERDGKIITAWNGFAIQGLIEASITLQDPALQDIAITMARKLIDRHFINGRLYRVSCHGICAQEQAVLEDYGGLMRGVLSIYHVQPDPYWLKILTELSDTVIDHFVDEQRPGRWFDTANDAPPLIMRPSDPSEMMTPSGASLITDVLLQFSSLMNEPYGRAYQRYAYQSLEAHSGLITHAPRAAGNWLTIIETLLT